MPSLPSDSALDPFCKRVYETVNLELQWGAPIVCPATRIASWAGQAGLSLEEVLPVLQRLERENLVRLSAAGGALQSVLFWTPIPADRLSPAKAPQTPFPVRDLYRQYPFLYLYGDSRRTLDFAEYRGVPLKDALTRIPVIPEPMALSARLTPARFESPEAAEEGLQLGAERGGHGEPSEGARGCDCRVRMAVATYPSRHWIYIPYQRRWEHADFLEHRASSFPECGRGGAPLYTMTRPTTPWVLEEWDGGRWVEVFNVLGGLSEGFWEGGLRGTVWNLMANYGGVMPYRATMGVCRDWLLNTWEAYLPLQGFLKELARAGIVELYQEPGPHLSDEEVVATLHRDIPNEFIARIPKRRTGAWLDEGGWKFRVND